MSDTASITENTIRRGPKGGHLWQKGESGNPKGRPKSDNPLIAEAKKLAPEALRIAAQLMRDETVNASGRVAALSIVLERAYGRPKQELDITHRRPEEMSDEELYERIDELSAECDRLAAEAARSSPGQALPPPYGSGSETSAEELQ